MHYEKMRRKLRAHKETIETVEDVFEGYGDLEHILQVVRETAQNPRITTEEI